LLLLHFANQVFAQESNIYRIAFYNVENLFDTQHDSLKKDYDFLPEGNHHWNKRKLYHKINGIAKTYMALSEWNGIAALGLCEIENEHVLKLLLHYSPLRSLPLRYIHYESPDKRGIDVAFIYDTSLLKIISSEPIRIQFPFDIHSKTRDILFIQAMIEEHLVYFFVTHLPSRYGGYMPTVKKRNFVAQTLRSKVDSILNTDSKANIIIMGDFNDEEDKESIRLTLNAGSIKDTTGKQNPLINLMACAGFNGKGTHKHQGFWGKLDHIIISKSILNHQNGFRLSGNKASAFKAPFLLEKDEKFLGEKPFRTYVGFKYHGGYSDHLPVFIDLIPSDK
jgi:hypothetical protein